jgi:hypothetical protein
MLSDLADGYESIAIKLCSAAQQLPGAFVVRNQVGNLAIIRASGEYAGYVDVLTGEVRVFGLDGKRLAV